MSILKEGGFARHKTNARIVWCVVKIDGDSVVCSYVDSKGRHEQTFNALELVPYNPPPKPRPTVI